MDDPVPVFDYRRELATYREELDDAIRRVLDSGWLILGREVAEFEREFASTIGVAHAIGVASGTDALTLALRAVGIGAGDEVITVANTAVPTVSAIRAVGAVPRFVDVDPRTLQMCPTSLSNIVTAHTRCILPVHLHGHPAEMDEINRIAAARSIPVIGDCAQAFGAALAGRDVGGLSTISCYSFYPTKNLGALGDGGMCVTDSEELATKLREVRQYGFRGDRVAHVEGVCSRLDELQAAILRVRLKHFAPGQQQRQRIATAYRDALQHTSLQLPCCNASIAHAWHQYVVRTPHRDRLMRQLKAHNIGFGIHYPQPIHLMPAYAFLGYKRGTLPHTELACEEILSLPMFPGMTPTELERVIAAVSD